MKRTIPGVILLLLGLAVMAGGLFVPSNYRGIDALLVTASADGTPSVVEEGLDLVKGSRIGSARMFLEVAEEMALPERESLERSLDRLKDPGLLAWGRPAPELTLLFQDRLDREKPADRPFVHWLIPRDSRLAVLRHLQASHRFGVRQVLQTRGLTNLVHFSPLDSSAGHPLDTVTLLTGLLLQGDHFGQPLKEAIESLALEAVKEGKIQALELAYLDLLSLGNRLDWGQLTDLLERCSSIEELERLAYFSRNRVADFHKIYAGAMLANSTGKVLGYLIEFGKSGLTDLEYGLRAGRGGVLELLGRMEQVNYRPLRDRLASTKPVSVTLGPILQAAEYSPFAGVTLKYGLILVGGLMLIGVGWLMAPVIGVRSPQHFFSTNQLVFLGGLLLLLFVLSEPFLFERTQTMEFPLRWKLPMLGEALTSTIMNDTQAIDSLTLVALIFFLVVQAVIYVICLVKLAEIRRQPVSSQLKLRLLENEENMFDSGLYAGLGGTVGSLVLLAMGIVDASLMAAYASTLFGIVFVALLKICHLRPYRKRLILDGHEE